MSKIKKVVSQEEIIDFIKNITKTDRGIEYFAAALKSGGNISDIIHINNELNAFINREGLKEDELRGVYLALQQMFSKATIEETRRMD